MNEETQGRMETEAAQGQTEDLGMTDSLMGVQQIPETDGKNKKRKTIYIVIIAIIIILLVGAIIAGVIIFAPPKGVHDYTVQKEQYYVEYSEEYDYWDVLTVEYPRIEGLDAELQEKVNQLLYDTAMDRVIYWHLEPSEDVKAFQEEIFHIFASDVDCEVPFHSQYLINVDFSEFYCAGHPLWYTNGTRRAVTIDLMTGETYELADLFDINEGFVKMWDESYSDDVDAEYGDEEEIEFLLSLFLANNEEVNEEYFCSPFFCLDENKDFVIGFSLDPVLGMACTMEPTTRSLWTQLSMEELEGFKKESEFWEKYEKSETTGEVLPCENKEENIWLGENASVWD